jgi:hypothetical protein
MMPEKYKNKSWKQLKFSLISNLLIAKKEN